MKHIPKPFICVPILEKIEKLLFFKLHSDGHLHFLYKLNYYPKKDGTSGKHLANQDYCYCIRWVDWQFDKDSVPFQPAQPKFPSPLLGNGDIETFFSGTPDEKVTWKIKPNIDSFHT